MKRILITNDDGIKSPGIRAAEEALKGLGELWVVAPKSQRSGSARASSPGKPIQVSIQGPNRYSVKGTPVDCVIIATMDLMPSVDLVVSGINLGANIGFTTVMWSGTCGAAFEASYLGVPAIASGQEFPPDVDPAAPEKSKMPDFSIAKSYLRQLAEKVLENGLPTGIDVLNINFPHGAHNGIAVEPLGPQYVRGTVQKRKDGYYITGVIEPKEVPQTDVYALYKERKIVITPLTLKGFDADIESSKKYLGDFK